ncbi:MAG: CDP-alcohol phosphatidyltransferase family protein [Candidatus Omnitrophica bacterium]|nr:CDP-alcohol phosphatidyltransferase family protein [Candidatus Omnitrophota bacterium]
MGQVTLANKISIIRIILIPFFITAVAYSRLDLALLVFAIAVISDGADGFIARALRQQTQLGTILDPIADKLLLTSAYICLSIVGNIPQHLRMPPYVPIIVISRDVIIAIGSIVIYVVRGDIKISPSIIGKVTTFFQMMTIVCILAQFNYSFIVWNITIFLTIASGLDYVMKGSKLLSENNMLKKAG